MKNFKELHLLNNPGYQKKRLGLLMLTLLVASLAFPPSTVKAEKIQLKTNFSLSATADPYSLIDQVNALRVSRGLPPYSSNSILMNVAQQQASYMSAAGVTHYGPDGSRPFQRGLAAGYPLAGDLSLGGFYSENIIAGDNMSVSEAVLAWQGDDAHLHTMLSPNLTEIGAGVVITADYVYFVIDCARPTGSAQPVVINTPVPGENTPTPGDSTIIAETPLPGPIVVNTLIPVTPDLEGKIWHIVSPGETLWLIAVSYNTKIVEIRKLNNLSEAQAIIPGQKLLVRQDKISTPIPISNTPIPSNTVNIPSTVLVTQTVTLPTDSTVVVLSVSTQHPAGSNFSLIILGLIILAAVVLTLVFIRILKKAE